MELIHYADTVDYVIIYSNGRNRTNDITESQKEKNICFNSHFHYSRGKCGSKTSLHVVQLIDSQALF